MILIRVLTVSMSLCVCGIVPADEPVDSPETWVERFTADWDEAAWTEKPRFRPAGYMRDAKDDGWQTRMRALQQLVLHGEASVPVLVELLRSGDAPQRILAAQALGYLPAADAKGPLLQAAAEDEDAAVRLYAVDSLGMLGADVDWDGLLEGASNGDVRKHISYAVERDGAVVEEDVISALRDWDSSTIDSAKVGEPAPEFALKSAQGETVRLADFQGEKAVVLVFVYGDT